jgi:hypothetical protein
MCIFALYRVEIIFMKTPSRGTKNGPSNRQTEAKKAKRRVENARKAKETAERLFPGEKWIQEDKGIYVSPRRKRTNFEEEFKDAQILRNFESTVYLVPENSRQSGRKYDAIVNGLQFEFKNVGGNGNTLAAHFLKSRSQAPNVFINLETSNLTRREVMGALYGARNSVIRTDRYGNIIKGYAERNKYQGGRIILKLKGHDNLIYLNVDDLKAPG